MSTPAATDPGRLLFRPGEAAAILGLGRTTIYELIASGELESVSLGTSRRVSRRALEEFVRRLEAGEIFAA